MSTILDDVDRTAKENTTMSDTVETTAPGAVKKVVSSVTGAVTSAAGSTKDVLSSAASTATDKVREHGPAAATKVKETTITVVTHDRTKAAARDRRVQVGLLGAVLAIVTLRVIRRRRQA
ncbi:MAG: hypothetical protein ACQR33_01560 [Candidatus Saccharibacteria bacterium]